MAEPVLATFRTFFAASVNFPRILPIPKPRIGPRVACFPPMRAMCVARKENTLTDFKYFLTQNGPSQGQNLALTGLFVPMRAICVAHVSGRRGGRLGMSDCGRAVF